MKKKIVSVMLASVLAISTLAGCSTNQSSEVATSDAASSTTNQIAETSKNETTTQTSTSSEPVEIEFWHALGGDLGNSIQSIIDSYNASQSEYVVKPVVIGSYSEIDEKLQAAYVAKNVPALVAGGSQDTFYQKDLVENFEDYMTSDYNQDDIVGGFLDAATRDRKMVFAPAYGTSQVLYYNKAVLDEAGYTETDLSNWQSLESLKDKVVGINTGKGQIQYVWEPMWGYENMVDVVSSAGGKFISEDGKTVLINDATWVSIFDQFRKWINEDKSMTIHSGGQGWEYWYKTMDDWVYGTSLGYTGSPGDYTIALEAITKAKADGYKTEFAVAMQPGWEDNDPAPYFSSVMYYIPKCSNLTEEQKKGAADFVTYATNTDNTAKFSMETGYAAVRNSVLDLADYQTYLESNPDADVALKQIDLYAVPEFVDPTGGAITTALKDAVDKIQIENVSAQEALDYAAKEAQKALDKVNQ
ncbi:MAG: extracellular solute-binding protein [Lachnotalea sp.]